MPHDRFYSDSPLEQEMLVSLKEAELHHLIVSRARIGQTVELINGKGKLAQATLTSLDKKQALLRIDSVSQGPEESPHIILAQGLPRMNHLEWIVEKGTELGVTAFWLFPGVLSEKSTLSENQENRLKHLVLAAMKQCGRLDLPEVVLKPPLSTWTPLDGCLLYADLSNDAPLLWKLTNTSSSPLILFIGPESGFDPKEVLHLEKVLKAQKVRLHPHTLRTETAAIAGLSLLQTLL
jgi:16S rRNA (uracil1498-N3)-methyltransferase